MKELDELEKRHQDLKREYFKWAKGKIPNNGYGHDNNKATTLFLKKHSKIASDVKKTLKVLKTKIKTLEDKEQKYNILREIYIIHPSFHEMWLFEGHYNHFNGKGKIINGRGGLKSYFTSLNHGTLSNRLKIITTWLFKRTILLENLFSGVLGFSLFDTNILNEKELIQNLRKINGISFETPEEVKFEMNNLFRICHTLLDKTNYCTLENNNLLSNEAWLEYSQCGINEGPIFIKKNIGQRINIFKKINTLNQNEIRKILEEHFKIEIIQPYNI